MAEPVTLQSAEHYTQGLLCEGWYLLRSPALSVNYERVAPGCGHARQQRRPAHQFFYILRGRATLEVAGQAVALAGAEGCAVPPDTPHRLRNAGDDDVTYLIIAAPAVDGARPVSQEGG